MFGSPQHNVYITYYSLTLQSSCPPPAWGKKKSSWSPFSSFPCQWSKTHTSILPWGQHWLFLLSLFWSLWPAAEQAQVTTCLILILFLQYHVGAPRENPEAPWSCSPWSCPYMSSFSPWSECCASLYFNSQLRERQIAMVTPLAAIIGSAWETSLNYHPSLP